MTLTGLSVMVLMFSYGMDRSLITLWETIKVLAIHNSNDGPAHMPVVEVSIWLYQTILKLMLHQMALDVLALGQS